MEITIFGPGCAKCTEAEKLVREVAESSNRDVTVRKISDFKGMMAAGVMSTPAVSVDGVVRLTGRIPTKDEVAAWIEAAG